MTESNKIRNKKIIRIILIIVALSVLIAGAVLISKMNPSSSDSGSVQATYTVRQQDLTISVTESGEIKARQSIDIKSEVEGRTTIISIVPEGTVITPNDVAEEIILVELDASDLKENLTQREINFEKAKADFTEAKEAYEIRQKQNESDIKADELKVKFALMDLQKYLSLTLAQEIVETERQTAGQSQDISEIIRDMINDPNDPRWGGAAMQKKRELEADIKLADEELKKAFNTLQGTEKLHKNKYVAFTELERDRLAHSRADIKAQQANTAIGLFLRYDFPKETEQKFSDYQESKRQLERTLAQARSQLAQAKAKLNSAEATYNLQKERLEKLRKQLKACTIRAATEGMVVYGSSTDFWARQNRPIEVGAEVRERQKIITIPNTNEMAATVQVHESWVDKVKPDMPVKITIDAFPDTNFTGKVLKVAPLPDPQQRWLDTGLKVYTTEASIDGRHDTLKPGMSAKVEIIIQQLNDVLCVPVQAVANRDGSKACYVVTSDGTILRKVKTGAFNDSFIEIIDGLSQGEKVSLIPPRTNYQDEKDKMEIDKDLTGEKDTKTPEQNQPDKKPAVK